MSNGRVMGVDACRAGWVGIAPDQTRVRGYVGSDIAEVVARAERDGELHVVAIDIPIGLPDEGRRNADVLAKCMVGPRRSSVFMTPVRHALLAPDHAMAVQINRDKAGEGISAQAYALRARVLSVEAWVRTTGRIVTEVHPEVSFAHLAGRPLRTRKKTEVSVPSTPIVTSPARLKRAEKMTTTIVLSTSGLPGVTRDHRSDAAGRCRHKP